MERLKINVEPSDEHEPLRITLPKLLNDDIIKHTNEFASKEILPVFESVKWATSDQLPPHPVSWTRDRTGWTKYLESGKHIQVEVPDCSTIILDTENCVDIGHVPIIAVAVSDKYWYSWLNPDIFNSEFIPNNRHLTEKNLIPIGRNKIVIVRVFRKFKLRWMFISGAGQFCIFFSKLIGDIDLILFAKITIKNELGRYLLSVSRQKTKLSAN